MFNLNTSPKTFYEYSNLHLIQDEKKEPIRLIINIVRPPSTELIISLNIIFIGIINIFPNMNKKKIQAIYVIILFKSKPYHLSLFNSMKLVFFYANIF